MLFIPLFLATTIAQASTTQAKFEPQLFVSVKHERSAKCNCVTWIAEFVTGAPYRFLLDGEMVLKATEKSSAAFTGLSLNDNKVSFTSSNPKLRTGDHIGYDLDVCSGERCERVKGRFSLEDKSNMLLKP